MNVKTDTSNDSSFDFVKPINAHPEFQNAESRGARDMLGLLIPGLENSHERSKARRAWSWFLKSSRDGVTLGPASAIDERDGYIPHHGRMPTPPDNWTRGGSQTNRSNVIANLCLGGALYDDRNAFRAAYVLAKDRARKILENAGNPTESQQDTGHCQTIPDLAMIAMLALGHGNIEQFWFFANAFVHGYHAHSNHPLLDPNGDWKSEIYGIRRFHRAWSEAARFDRYMHALLMYTPLGNGDVDGYFKKNPHLKYVGTMTKSAWTRWGEWTMWRREEGTHNRGWIEGTWLDPIDGFQVTNWPYDPDPAYHEEKHVKWFQFAIAAHAYFTLYGHSSQTDGRIIKRSQQMANWALAIGFDSATGKNMKSSGAFRQDADGSQYGEPNLQIRYDEQSPQYHQQFDESVYGMILPMIVASSHTKEEKEAMRDAWAPGAGVLWNPGEVSFSCLQLVRNWGLLVK